tara:strand:- start:47815 stop:48162 length:348 start_codon:yes stop_codon:yes gene_type:complete
MSSLADTLETPYYAAIIESTPQADFTASETITTADQLVSLAVRRPGFLGLETARGVDGRALTVAYWRELADVEGWTMAGQATAQGELNLEVKRVANAADNAVRALYVVPEESRAV